VVGVSAAQQDTLPETLRTLAGWQQRCLRGTPRVCRGVPRMLRDSGLLPQGERVTSHGAHVHVPGVVCEGRIVASSGGILCT